MSGQAEILQTETSTNNGIAPASDEYTCSGDNCGGAKFLSSAVGCSVLLMLCPKCNGDLRDELGEGKSVVNYFIARNTLS
jgi:hypothetical protein